MDLNSLPYQPHSHGSSGDVIVSEALRTQQSPTDEQGIASGIASAPRFHFPYNDIVVNYWHSMITIYRCHYLFLSLNLGMGTRNDGSFLKNS